MAVEPSGSSPVSRKPTTCGISIETGWPSIAASASMPPTPQPSTPEAVDHRGVGVGADERVGEGLPVARLDHAREVLEVDLVADAGVRRHDAEVVERRLAPAQERVALAVALELELGVALEGEPLGEHVDLDRVVDHELDGHQRVDLGRVAAQLVHRVAHRGQVDDRGHAGEVLHQHARGRVGDLLRRLVGRHPARHRPRPLVLAVAQQVLEQHLQRVRQPGDVVLRLERVEAEDLVRLAAHLEGRAGAEAVLLAHVLDTTQHARPGLRDPPALDLLGRDRHGARRSPGRAGAPGSDVVLLTDHDTLAALRNGEEGWYGDVLLLVGEEVSPRRRNHYLAFGIDEEIDHARPRRRRHLRGGARRGRLRLRRPPVLARLGALRARGPGHAVRRASTARRSTGIELWSFVTDTGESLDERRRRAALHRRARPRRSTHPPERNLRAWDELCRAPAGGGDRRARRPPVRQADRAGRAAADDGLPPLVPLHPHPRALRRRADARARARPRAGLRRAARGALLHRRRLDRARRAASASRPTTCRWAPRRPPGAARCAPARPRDARLRLLRDGARDRGRRRPRARGTRSRRRASTAWRRCGATAAASAPGSCRTRSTCGAGRSRAAGTARQPDDVRVRVVGPVEAGVDRVDEALERRDRRGHVELAGCAGSRARVPRFRRAQLRRPRPCCPGSGPRSSVRPRSSSPSPLVTGVSSAISRLAPVLASTANSLPVPTGRRSACARRAAPRSRWR